MMIGPLVAMAPTLISETMLLSRLLSSQGAGAVVVDSVVQSSPLQSLQQQDYSLH